MTTTPPRALVLLVGVLLLAACGGEGASSSEEASGRTSDLPVREPTGAVDPELADRGRQLFKTRGCVSCHTFGEGRRVGPDLEGVADRRTFEWTYHMVLDPDSMVQNDSIARALLSEYFTPMSDQNVRPEEFRALWEYMRSESGAPGGAS